MSQAAPPPHIADRYAPFGTTIFAEFTTLANEHGAVNLSQGFPDFDGPAFVKQAAHAAIDAGHNQYAPMPGTPELRAALARHWKRASGLDADVQTEITVTAGCTEAINAAMLGLINPGDPVVVFEPYYDCYRASIAVAGGVPRFVALRPDADGRFTFDERELREACAGARALLLNTPHNPTGKVFTRDELALIASLCQEHHLIAITDEVYERLTFEPDLPHITLASLPGMRARTVTLSSLGKTYSLTGWKVGWAIAPPHLTAGVRAAHQFLTYAVSHPMQLAAAIALDEGEAYVAELVQSYASARAHLADALTDLGFRVFRPEGTYFIMADHTELSRRVGVEGDFAFCRWLTTRAGVAAIPPSVFYDRPEFGRPLVRFAFCKTSALLDEAIGRLTRALK